MLLKVLASPLPANPVAKGITHDEFHVRVGDPIDLLEMSDALLP